MEPKCDVTFNCAANLDRAAVASPLRESLRYGTQTWTVEAAAHETRRLAELLIQAGVARGDRVAFVSHNSPYHFLLYMACARVGAVFVPLDARLELANLEQYLSFIAPRVIVAEPEIAALATFEEAGAAMRFVVDNDIQAGSFTEGQAAGYFGLTAAAAAFPGEIVSDGVGDCHLNRHEYPSGPAAIMFTSGSAGASRAVELTHENLWWAARSFRESFEYTADDVALAVAPLSRVIGFLAPALDIFASGGLVIIQRVFDASAVLRTISQQHVSVMYGTPDMYSSLESHPNFGMSDLSNWRLPLIGGAPVPLELLRALRTRGLTAIQMWGIAESAGAGTYLPRDLSITRMGSIGWPAPYIRAKIVDPVTREELSGVNVIGELAISGPSLARSYWHDAANSGIEFDGDWLYTGDIVMLDADGFMHLRGRTSSLIICAGERIYPESIEEILEGMPGVAACALVGIPDDALGQKIAVAIVGEDPVAPIPSADQVREYLQMRVAPFKIPRVVVSTASLPVFPSGRIDRDTLAQTVEYLCNQESQCE